MCYLCMEVEHRRNVKTTGRTYHSIGLEMELEATETGKNKRIHTYKFFLIAIQPLKIHSNTGLSLILSKKILQNHISKEKFLQTYTQL